MPDRDRKRVPDHWSHVLKGSLPQGPTAHPRNMEYLRLKLVKEESEKESRDEATQRGKEEQYQRQCRSRREIFWKD